MSERSTERRSINWKVVGAIVVAVLALIFILQNTATRRVHFLFWSTSMPVWIWLVIIFAAGVVVGSALPWLRRRRRD
jgi:uncharacterized integral membrane protein